MPLMPLIEDLAVGAILIASAAYVYRRYSRTAAGKDTVCGNCPYADSCDSRAAKEQRAQCPGAPPEPRTLFDMVTGQAGRITRIRGGGAQSIRQRLLDMGVTKGTEVRVERHAPLGDPVEVTIKGYYLALRMDEARHIDVEVI